MEFHFYPFESRSTGFRRPMRYNPKLAPTVYRLMGAALIGIFFYDPFFFFKSKFWSNVENSLRLDPKGYRASSVLISISNGGVLPSFLLFI